MVVALSKLICWGVVCFGLAGAVALKAALAMRRGERYRFGFLDGGLLLQGRDAPPRLVLGGAATYALVVGAILAWPAGLYEWIGEATSACREIVPEDDVRALGGEAFADVRVQELGAVCSFEMSTPDYDTFRMEVDGFTRAGVPEDATRLAVDDVELWTAERGQVRYVWLTGEPRGSMKATLSTERFDDRATRQVAQRMVDRRDVLTEAAQEAWAQPSATSSFLRKNAPWLFLAFFVLVVVGAIVVLRLRQKRAMKRVLEELDEP